MSDDIPKKMGRDVTGVVFDIKKFAIHDGPGIRTTVFVKGCPLSCVWCHNPESQEFKREVSFMPDKCIGCGYCFKTCPNHAHVMDGEKHVIKRELCERCGECAKECYAQAIEVIGKEMTVQEALDEVLKDKPFYETSDGGMTISGGEPMSQYEFTYSLLEAAKEEGLHTCLDTSGYAKYERYEKLLPFVDIFLYDLKETDPENHLKLAGVRLDVILENLRKLDAAGARTVLRCPIVDELNDSERHLKKIAEIAESLKHVIEIDIHPYHPLGKSKSERIGKNYELRDKTFVDEDVVEKWIETIQAGTKVSVKKA